MSTEISKGHKMEELLKSYFHRSGYFVVRGAKYRYSGFDITDIDLWLYTRTPISRKITIVDIKNKKTPQAIERIFWTYGLKNAIKADDAIVATTDKRREVAEYGNKLGVLVLDGNFLSRLRDSKTIDENYLISEESFTNIVKSYEYHKLDGDWTLKLEESKSILVENPGFDSCIFLLGVGKYFSNKTVTGGNHALIAARILYRITSYILISLDIGLSKISFLEESERKNSIRNGLIYGNSGQEGFDQLLSLGKNLIYNFATDGERVYAEIQRNITRETNNVKIDYLVEFFSRSAVQSILFSVARTFEVMSLHPSQIALPERSESKAILYLLLDFWGVGRVDFERSIIGHTGD